MASSNINGIEAIKSNDGQDAHFYKITALTKDTENSARQILAATYRSEIQNAVSDALKQKERVLNPTIAIGDITVQITGETDQINLKGIKDALIPPSVNVSVTVNQKKDIHYSPGEGSFETILERGISDKLQLPIKDTFGNIDLGVILNPIQINASISAKIANTPFQSFTIPAGSGKTLFVVDNILNSSNQPANTQIGEKDASKIHIVSTTPDLIEDVQGKFRTLKEKEANVALYEYKGNQYVQAGRDPLSKNKIQDLQQYFANDKQMYDKDVASLMIDGYSDFGFYEKIEKQQDIVNAKSSGKLAYQTGLMLTQDVQRGIKQLVDPKAGVVEAFNSLAKETEFFAGKSDKHNTHSYDEQGNKKTSNVNYYAKENSNMQEFKVKFNYANGQQFEADLSPISQMIQNLSTQPNFYNEKLSTLASQLQNFNEQIPLTTSLEERAHLLKQYTETSKEVFDVVSVLEKYKEFVTLMGKWESGAEKGSLTVNGRTFEEFGHPKSSNDKNDHGTGLCANNQIGVKIKDVPIILSGSYFHKGGLHENIINAFSKLEKTHLIDDLNKFINKNSEKIENHRSNVLLNIKEAAQYSGIALVTKHQDIKEVAEQLKSSAGNLYIDEAHNVQLNDLESVLTSIIPQNAIDTISSIKTNEGKVKEIKLLLPKIMLYTATPNTEVANQIKTILAEKLNVESELIAECFSDYDIPQAVINQKGKANSYSAYTVKSKADIFGDGTKFGSVERAFLRHYGSIPMNPMEIKRDINIDGILQNEMAVLKNPFFSSSVLTIPEIDGTNNVDKTQMISNKFATLEPSDEFVQNYRDLLVNQLSTKLGIFYGHKSTKQLLTSRYSSEEITEFERLGIVRNENGKMYLNAPQKLSMEEISTQVQKAIPDTKELKAQMKETKDTGKQFKRIVQVYIACIKKDNPSLNELDISRSVLKNINYLNIPARGTALEKAIGMFEQSKDATANLPSFQEAIKKAQQSKAKVTGDYGIYNSIIDNYPNDFEKGFGKLLASDNKDTQNILEKHGVAKSEVAVRKHGVEGETFLLATSVTRASPTQKAGYLYSKKNGKIDLVKTKARYCVSSMPAIIKNNLDIKNEFLTSYLKRKHVRVDLKTQRQLIDKIQSAIVKKLSASSQKNLSEWQSIERRFMEVNSFEDISGILQGNQSKLMKDLIFSALKNSKLKEFKNITSHYNETKKLYSVYKSREDNAVRVISEEAAEKLSIKASLSVYEDIRNQKARSYKQKDLTFEKYAGKVIQEVGRKRQAAFTDLQIDDSGIVTDKLYNHQKNLRNLPAVNACLKLMHRLDHEDLVSRGAENKPILYLKLAKDLQNSVDCLIANKAQAFKTFFGALASGMNYNFKNEKNENQLSVLSAIKDMKNIKLPKEFTGFNKGQSETIINKYKELRDGNIKTNNIFLSRIANLVHQYKEVQPSVLQMLDKASLKDEQFMTKVLPEILPKLKDSPITIPQLHNIYTTLSKEKVTQDVVISFMRDILPSSKETDNVNSLFKTYKSTSKTNKEALRYNPLELYRIESSILQQEKKGFIGKHEKLGASQGEKTDVNVMLDAAKNNGVNQDPRGTRRTFAEIEEIKKASKKEQNAGIVG